MQDHRVGSPIMSAPAQPLGRVERDPFTRLRVKHQQRGDLLEDGDGADSVATASRTACNAWDRRRALTARAAAARIAASWLPSAATSAAPARIARKPSQEDDAAG